jgi:glutamate-1-semialdehyde 2,1-aminomutase
VENSRYSKSLTMLAAAKECLAGGASSPFRSKLPVPLFFEDAQGPRLRDVDGNEYIDYALAWGPLILGHRHPRLVEVMRAGAERPHIYGAQHSLERKVAMRIQELVPCAERVAFTSSGSEAVQCAMRLARAWTGREKVLRFEGHYHGWMDSALLSYRATLEQLGPEDAPVPVLGSMGQPANAVENAVTAQWNDLERVREVLRTDGPSIAAVICEPICCNSGSLEPDPGFLQALRELTLEHGVLLIFDEVITGMRIEGGSAQAAFGVTPDIATLGKAVGGGLPLSVIAGRADLMEQMAAGTVIFGGTFNGNPLSLAAADATLDELFRDDAAALKHANRMGYALRAGIEEQAHESGLPLMTSGFGAAFSLHFRLGKKPKTYREFLENDKQALTSYVRDALDEGIYLLPEGRIYVSAVHTQREVDETVAAIGRVFSRMTVAVN